MIQFDFDNILTFFKLATISSTSILFGFIVYKTIQIYGLIRKYKEIPGFEANSILEFYLGNALDFLKCSKNGLNLAQFCDIQVKKYGLTCKMRLYDQVAVITSDPNFIKDIFIDGNYPKHGQTYRTFGFPFNERFVGYGLGAETNQEKWKSHREFLNPGFHKQALMGFIKEFNATGDVLMTYLRKHADGKTKISLLEEFNRASLDVICRAGFTMNIDSINERNNKLCEYVKLSFESIQMILQRFDLNYNPFLWPDVLKYKKVIREIRQIGREQIQKRFEAIKNDEYVPNDILTIILTNRTEREINIELLVDDFVNFLVGGQETTATTLSFVFRELCRNPEVLKKLRNEIDTVIGSKSDIEYQDLTELKYTEAVFKETLRLYPAAPLFFRTPTQDIKMEKFTIPKDSWIITSTYTSSRMEEFFPEPLKFRPERFLQNDNDVETSSKVYTYYPFSLGPRNCIGQNFAKLESKLMIAKFIQNFEFKLDPDERMLEDLNVTLHPVDSTSVFLTLR